VGEGEEVLLQVTLWGRGGGGVEMEGEEVLLRVAIRGGQRG
jgi:hypothetical protein